MTTPPTPLCSRLESLQQLIADRRDWAPRVRREAVTVISETLAALAAPLPQPTEVNRLWQFRARQRTESDLTARPACPVCHSVYPCQHQLVLGNSTERFGEGVRAPLPSPSLVDRLRASADEVESFPHPSHCDHLHIAFKVMREAADALEVQRPVPTPSVNFTIEDCARICEGLAYLYHMGGGGPVHERFWQAARKMRAHERWSIGFYPEGGVPVDALPLRAAPQAPEPGEA